MRTAKASAAKLIALEGGKAEAQRELVSKYEAIFDQASDAILAVLADGTIDAANQASEEMTGYLKGEIVQASVDLLVPDPSRHRIQNRTARPISREIFAVPGTYEDIAILRKDGYIRFVDVTVRLVESGKTCLALALFRDLTEKKRMERELITKHSELRNAYVQLEKKNAELQTMQDTLVQSGKMAALGELAAGIAHELNQPLQGIRGYTQELRDLALPELVGRAIEAQAQDSIREIVSNVDKMSAIIGYLRSFVGKSQEKHEMSDVHAAIEESLKMLSRQFASRGIQVHRDFQRDLPAIYGNPLQIEQVLINLATNARDAIEATGRGSGNIWIRTRSAGQFVEVTYRDDGCGMTEKTRTKIFNPFFTTKEVGKGMGLGMSLSYGILSKIQGSIMVESELGKGTCFLIRIPRDFRELA